MSWACGPRPKSLYSSAFPSLTSSCLRSWPTIQNLQEIVDVCSRWSYSSVSRSGALKNRTSIKWAKQSLGECQDFPYWVHLPLIPVKSFLLGWNGECFEFPVSFEVFSFCLTHLLEAKYVPEVFDGGQRSLLWEGLSSSRRSGCKAPQPDWHHFLEFMHYTNSSLFGSHTIIMPGCSYSQKVLNRKPNLQSLFKTNVTVQ